MSFWHAFGMPPACQEIRGNLGGNSGLVWPDLTVRPGLPKIAKCDFWRFLIKNDQKSITDRWSKKIIDQMIIWSSNDHLMINWSSKRSLNDHLMIKRSSNDLLMTKRSSIFKKSVFARAARCRGRATARANFLLNSCARLRRRAACAARTCPRLGA